MTGPEITDMRKKLEISQETLARILMVSYVTVNRWEGGHSGPKGLHLVFLLALQRWSAHPGKTGPRPKAMLREWSTLEPVLMLLNILDVAGPA